MHDSPNGGCNGPDNCPDVANPGQENADGDSLGDACDPDPVRPPHDGVTKVMFTVGPAAINLSDTTGRYMWIIAEVGNQGGPPTTETATVTMDIAEAVPNGCTRTPDDNDAGNGLNEALILPGQHEDKVDHRRFPVLPRAARPRACSPHSVGPLSQISGPDLNTNVGITKSSVVVSSSLPGVKPAGPGL